MMFSRKNESWKKINDKDDVYKIQDSNDVEDGAEYTSMRGFVELDSTGRLTCTKEEEVDLNGVRALYEDDLYRITTTSSPCSTVSVTAEN